MFGFSKNIGIDLGTANVLVYVQGEGIVLNEPSVVAFDAETKKPLAVGTEARDMLGKTPGQIKAMRPLKDGVIADFEATDVMLNYFINKLDVKGFLSRPRILICCPANITQVEKNAIKEVAERCGAKEVLIEEEPKVAAVGVGLDIGKPSGNMIVDMGGGTTDIAVLSLGDIVTSKSIKIAGNKIDELIIDHLKNKYKLLIGDRTAEEIKKEIANAYQGTSKTKKKVRGRDLVSGLPHTVTVSSDEIRKAIMPAVTAIGDASAEVLENTPPELAADIIEKGIIITGGGALLKGLDKYLAKRLEVPVLVAEDPLNAVAIGTGIMLENLSQR